MVSERLKQMMFGLGFFIWGILTGRTLPQWEDMANGPYWIMYWFMIIVVLGISIGLYKRK